MANGIEVIQNKFLKLVWILTNRDWTNEMVIIGVIVLACWDLSNVGKDGTATLANTIGGGLIGYLTRAVQDMKESAKILQFPAPTPEPKEPEARTGTDN